MNELLDVLAYEPDTGLFRWKVDAGRGRKKGFVAGSTKKDGYRVLSYGGKSYQLHRVAWFFVHGEVPAMKTDHINGERSDNRIENLRVVTDQYNAQNRSLEVCGSSGYAGVTRAKGKWRAQIMVGPRVKHLGFFLCPAEAHAAYVKAKIELHLGFARITEETERLVNQETRRSTRAGKRTGLVGVAPGYGGKFTSKIKKDGVTYWLGTFDTAQDAQEAYLAAKRQNNEECTS